MLQNKKLIKESLAKIENNETDTPDMLDFVYWDNRSYIYINVYTVVAHYHVNVSSLKENLCKNQISFVWQNKCKTNTM